MVHLSKAMSTLTRERVRAGNVPKMDFFHRETSLQTPWQKSEACPEVSVMNLAMD